MAKKSTAIEKAGKKGGLAKKGQWKDQMAKHAADVAANEATPAGMSISVRGGVMSIGGNEIKGNALDVVVVDHCYENCYYPDGYDEKNPTPPSCFAIGRVDKELKPHPKSKTPQHESCEGCPMNAWGSADNSERGKACKNTRRMLCLSADNLSAESIKNGELANFKPPVTSVKAWSYHVKYLNSQMQLPPFAVITKISCQPDKKTQVKVNFEAVGPVEEDLMDAIMERRGGFDATVTTDIIMRPYDPPADKEPAKKGGKAAKNKKGKRF